jgi:23S rRNA pseudouridine1911/1915/1917 synthase
MVASKNDAAHLALAAQFHAHSVTRRYLALVDGVLLQPSGVFDTLYGRDPRNRKRFSSRVERGKPALTRYQVLARLPAATLVEVTPGTGRTHQIRVHFHDHGHPLVGDPEYGRRSRDPAVRAAAEVLGRQALHARLLGFVHPASNAYLELASPLPADFARALDLLQPPEPPEQPAAASPGRPSGGR